MMGSNWLAQVIRTQSHPAHARRRTRFQLDVDGAGLESRTLLSIGFAAYGAPVQNGSSTDLTLGPDGDLWFVEKGNAIGKLAPSGRVTSYPLPTPAAENAGTAAIVVGSDGNLWFTNSDLPAIGRITPSGVITEFPVPATSAGAHDVTDITLGAKGTLWFADGDAMGLITTSGAVKLFNLPSYENYAGTGAGMVEGSDGNLWYIADAYIFAPEIDRITPQGVVTRFPTDSGPNGQIHPEALTRSPKGGIAFTYQEYHYRTDPTSSGVGMIGMAGQYSILVSRPGLTVGGTSLAYAPDGSLWEANGTDLFRIDGGVVSQYAPLTAGSDPTAIIVGMGGLLDYSTTNSTYVGTIVPESASPPPSIIPRYAEASAGENWAGAVVSFKDTNPGVTLGNLKANVGVGSFQAAGDFETRSEQPGQIVADGNGVYTVYGAWDTLNLGYEYEVTIFDTHASPAGLGSTTSFVGTVSTANQAAIWIGGGDVDHAAVTPIIASSGGPITGLNAAFSVRISDVTNPLGTATATIAWGDGTTTTISSVKTGYDSSSFDATYSVIGAHTYAKPGLYVVKVRLFGSAAGVGLAAVSDALFDDP